jgi:hypothetical protein
MRLTIAMIHVHKLPQRLQMASRPTTMVMTVVQKATWYAMKFHLATRLYTFMAPEAASPSTLSWNSCAFSLALLMALVIALSPLLVPVGTSASVALRANCSTGSKTKPDCLSLQ